ncbi:MAG: YkuS family protein [Bacillota bacterium]
MKKKVAVESQLSNISEYLEDQGYEVMEFQHNEEMDELLRDVDAVVVTGMDEDYLGMHDIMTDAVVIEASGMTPEEIETELEERLY